MMPSQIALTTTKLTTEAKNKKEKKGKWKT